MARSSFAARVDRAREDLLHFTGNLVAGRFRGAPQPKRRHLCSFCGRHRSVVKTLVEGRGFQICEGCVVEGAQMFTKDSGFDRRRRLSLREASLSCSACGRSQIQVRGLFYANDHRLCEECLFTCVNLLLAEGILLLDATSRARTMTFSTRGRAKRSA